MYRENKYGEKIEVEKYSCGSCANYCFEREDDTNKCIQYGRYFYMDDSCKNYWQEANECQGGSDCFLTTCCCEYKGLPDDCHELQTMRHVRDSYLMKTETGTELVVKLYYKMAPTMVEELKNHPKRNEIMEWMWRCITEIVADVDAKKFDEAIGKYVVMVINTEKKLKEIDC